MKKELRLTKKQIIEIAKDTLEQTGFIKKEKEFKIEYINEDDLRGFAIPFCQKNNHIQQVAFSTYYNCLTQICFNCRKIRTSIKKGDLK